MARPIKHGIDYFPADVDMFSDRKIKRLLRAVGGNGFTVYIDMLTRIYRDNGYFYEWDEHSAFDISDDLNFSENLVQEAINACCAIGLFNKELYAECSVLSSESIQIRWQKIVKDANRSETNIEPSYSLLGEKQSYPPKKPPNASEETPEKSRESTQSKVKESKGKERKGEYNHPPPRKPVVHYPDEQTFIDYGMSALRFEQGFLKEIYDSKVGTAQDGYFLNGSGNRITNWKHWMQSLKGANSNWKNKHTTNGKHNAHKRGRGADAQAYLSRERTHSV